MGHCGHRHAHAGVRLSDAVCRKPDLDAGIYAYAKAGFGEYFGFASAAGYWIGCCLADVACLILIKATIGQFFPIFGDGTTPMAIVRHRCCCGPCFPGATGHQGSDRAQHDCDLHQDHPDPSVHRRGRRRHGSSVVPAELLGNGTTERSDDISRRSATRCFSPCSSSSASREQASIPAMPAIAPTLASRPLLGFLTVLSLLSLYAPVLRRDAATGARRPGNTVHGRRHGGDGRPLGSHFSSA